MARFMMSAAVPCIGALIAVRSAAFAHGTVLRMDLRQVQATAEQGFDEALLRGLGAGPFHVRQDAGVAGEVTVDVGLGLLALDADLLGQAEGAHAVDQSEVDRLGAASLVAVDVFQRHAEDFRRGGAVYVQVVAEGIQQAIVLPSGWAMIRSSICE